MMNRATSAAVATGAAVPAVRAGASASRRLVIDAPMRMWHWLTVLSFAGAYVTAESEHWRALHVSLGYGMMALIAFRLLYGLAGPRPARLAPLLRKLSGLPAWLRTTVSELCKPAIRTIDWRQAQNLAMALAAVALLALAVPLVLSGHATFNDWGVGWGGRFDEDALAELHEAIAEAFLALILAHVGLVLALSVIRHRNLALPMLTGRAEGPGPNLVKHNRRWLAALLALCVVGFAAWQWPQASADTHATDAEPLHAQSRALRAPTHPVGKMRQSRSVSDRPERTDRNDRPARDDDD